jgi:hypothetical protein
MEQSLQATIESALIGAKNAHHLAVEQGTENDDNWPRYYAEFIVRRLVPLMTAFQSEHANTCPIVSGESRRESPNLPGWFRNPIVSNCHDTGDC